MFDNIRYVSHWNVCIFSCPSLGEGYEYELNWNGHGYLEVGSAYVKMSADHKAF